MTFSREQATGYSEGDRLIFSPCQNVRHLDTPPSLSHTIARPATARGHSRSPVRDEETIVPFLSHPHFLGFISPFAHEMERIHLMLGGTIGWELNSHVIHGSKS